MLQLKDYQQRALDSLRDYFAACVRLDDADTAFYEITKRNFEQGIPYRPVAELRGLPYVCLRIPTGGGKTLVACYAVSVALKNLLNADRCVVLWLVPSNAIREQTLRALKNRRHPYRQALEETLGSVTILDIADALYVQRPTLDTETTIIVSTLQAFRVEETEGRKVYEEAGALMGHFQNLPDEILRALDRRDNGEPIYSLANVLRLRRPVVIVDEAHNARTDLSFDTLARFNPSCIIEFTATPNRESSPSNVLHSVSAAELDTEAMIKMPIRLETRTDWKELLNDAVALRARLEQEAHRERQETGEYLRPVILIQAQPRHKHRETLTVDVVKKALIDDFRIPENQIAIATAEEKGLEGVDILDSKCEIRFVITVYALKEGWDCPFAYVLCSVADMRGATAVEQILGRVMRLPQAKRKNRAELNMAYAFATQDFAQAASALEDALVENGFEKQEAEEFIAAMPPKIEELPLFAPAPTQAMTVQLTDALPVERLAPETAAKISYDIQTQTVTLRERLDENDLTALKACVPTPAAEKIYRQSRTLPAPKLTPSQRGECFSIPVLAIQQGDLFEQLEDTHFIEREWNLSGCDAALTEQEFPSKRPEGQLGEIAITERGRFEIRFLSNLQSQMAMLDADQGWDIADLILWLDRKIYHPDITPTESGIFLQRLVRYLIEQRGFSLEQLVLDKFRLRDAVERKIDAHRKRAYKTAYQALLLPDCATPLVVNPDICFSYDPQSYPYSALYHGRYQFNKHYYPRVGDLKDEGEEFECARFLDMLPQVKFWIRNLDQRPPQSFWLQTSTDRFYPDFVCQLNDGRYLVVEYKGADRWSNEDSKEKRDLGELWEKRSGGRCLFVMPKGKDWNAIKAKIAG
jgi:type III restriction enzyme